MIALSSSLPRPNLPVRNEVYAEAAAADVGISMGDICKPAACSTGFGDCNGSQVTLTPFPVNISSWDKTSKSYTQVGQIMSHALQETEASEFGIFLHGPLMRNEDNKAPGKTIPPIYFSSSFKNKVWRLDDVDQAQPLANNWTGSLTLMGDAVAPSTTYPITDGPKGTGKLKGFFVAEGNPFYFNHLNGTMSMNKGGVTYMGNDSGPKDDGTKCTKMFPTSPFNPFSDAAGNVVNTVDCHKETGMCFFSVWKFYDDSFPEMLAPDCLHWCSPDDMMAPTKCVSQGVLLDAKGNKVCHQKKQPNHIGGAVHGFTVGNTDPDDTSKFDLLLIFTGGAGFDQGSSSMHLYKVQVGLDSIKTLSNQPYGMQLWNDTVTEPHDTGLDHAWVDATRKLVWVTSFRTQNAGIHMLDYATGDLLYSIHGFGNFFPGEYLYPAGVSGYGTMGRKGSYLTIATSTQKGLTVPPLLKFGKAALFVMDISKVLSVMAYSCKMSMCVPDYKGISYPDCKKSCSIFN